MGHPCSAEIRHQGFRVGQKTPGEWDFSWGRRLDLFLEFSEREILQDKGKITTEIAKAHAESEFEKYRIVQDRLFESDFDRIINQIANEK